MLLAPALLALACWAFATRSAVVNTDWRVLLGEELMFVMLLGTAAVPFFMLLHGLGYLWMRRGPEPFRRRAWWLGLVFPALGAVVLIAFGVLDRVFPERLFARFAGIDLPASARVVDHTYNGTVLEDHFVITFDASHDEIEALVMNLGALRRQQGGKEIFRMLSVEGDHGQLEVDWVRGRATFEYLDA